MADPNPTTVIADPVETSPFDWHAGQITRATAVTTGYKNTQNVRRFLQSQCGPRFKFHRPFMKWIVDGARKTMGDVVDEWLRRNPSSGRPFLVADSSAIDWKPSAFAAGVFVKDLGSSDGQSIQLVRFEPRARFPAHQHSGPEFLYVIEGEAIQRGKRLGPGWVGLAPAGTEEDDFWSEVGCTFITVYRN